MEPKLLTQDRFVDQTTGFTYRYILSDTEYFCPHYHDFCEVFLMLNGHARHMVNGQLINLRPRDMVFIRPSDIHDYASSDGSTFSMLNIAFHLQTLEQVFTYLGEGFPSAALMESFLPPIVQLTKSEMDAFNSKMTAISAISSTETSRIRTALRVLIFDLFSVYFSDYSPEHSSIPTWLEVLCSEMRKNANFVEGSEKLFSLTDKSREHVCRSMKKHLGITVSEYINDLRLTYICNMLSSSNHSVAEIVFNSGFNNLSWASEQFKKKYGMTMRQFRANSYSNGK